MGGAISGSPMPQTARIDSLTVRAETLLGRIRRAASILSGMGPPMEEEPNQPEAESPAGLTAVLRCADEEMQGLVSTLERMGEALGRL